MRAAAPHLQRGTACIVTFHLPFLLALSNLQVLPGNRDLTSPYEVSAGYWTSPALFLPCAHSLRVYAYAAVAAVQVVGFAGKPQALSKPQSQPPPTFLPNGIYARARKRTVLVESAADVQQWAKDRYQHVLDGMCRGPPAATRHTHAARAPNV